MAALLEAEVWARGERDEHKRYVSSPSRDSGLLWSLAAIRYHSPISVILDVDTPLTCKSRYLRQFRAE